MQGLEPCIILPQKSLTNEKAVFAGAVDSLPLAVLVGTQLEELLGIISADLLLVDVAQVHAVIPVTGIPKRLERVVNGKQDAVCANLGHTVLQRWCRKVPARCDPQVPLKVVPDGELARQAKRLLDVLEPVVDAPDVKGQVLAQVTEDDLQLWVTVEDAVGHHAECVEADTLGEAQRRTDEPGSLGPELLVDGACGVSRVEVEGDVELRDGRPEDVPVLAVVEDHVVTVGTATLCVVDEGSLEAVLGHTASELRGSLIWVVHGQGSVRWTVVNTCLSRMGFGRG